MAGSSHTPACSLSKLRSSLEAGKKQPRVWLQYGCCVTDMLPYPSFRVPLVFLFSPYGDSKISRECHGDLTDVYASVIECSSSLRSED